MSDPAPPEPLTLSEVKLNLRLDTSSEDTLLSGLIVAAREYVEDCTGLVLTPRTVTETAPQLGRWVDLSSWPVSGVSEIRYPLAGVMTPLATSAWLVSTKRRPVRLLPSSFGWGVSGTTLVAAPGLPVEIDVAAGFATPGDVPQSIRQAMQLLVAHWYANRSSAEVGARAAAVEIPFGVAELLRRWRLVTV